MLRDIAALQCLAMLCTVAGAAGLCLSAPRRRTAPLRPALRQRVACALLWGAGVACWSVVLQPVAGFFAALTMTMLVWVVLPYVAAWRLAQRTRHRADDGAR